MKKTAFAVAGILLYLFVSSACADNWQRPQKPYERRVTVPWMKIPYPFCDYDLPQKDGTVYMLTNPAGFACEPWYGSEDWFEIRVIIDPVLLTVTITGAWPATPIW